MNKKYLCGWKTANNDRYSESSHSNLVTSERGDVLKNWKNEQANVNLDYTSIMGVLE